MTGQLVWLITGTSSGLGRLMTLEALKRGDKVIATTRARSLHKLDDLKQQGADVLELEVTAPLEQLHETAQKAMAIHGGVDVLVNNAGYYCTGALEETTPQETYDQFNTNVFGGLNMNRAFLPYMRARKTGTVVWLGSIAGWISLVNAGLYTASKAATRLISMTLNDELAPIGLRSMVFEFGYFRTEFLSATQRTPRRRTSARRSRQRHCGHDDFIRGEGVPKDKKVPTIVHLGTDTLNSVTETCKETLQRIDEWKDVFVSTDFPKGE
ncbi:hypothetical protein EWM64_g6480 [Hericium alpestre]|uniref:NAD(P)-binding protein n=1 Tax=Hericium alpestre TaxID=135208 RepID=A0A4Y9ZSK0_9AGAM|nr:hypothetical protein EWM64_g6480 [Hericium alpestre]